ncbi:Fe(3+) ABC transporter substrate-binding protein [Sporosarcina sp. P33]|uniref:Fe(3+) ABC transporter substrate-binding protein n=1 Tax=Sporosarcina sp. P33 TaxID=1930764 RepID=UPI0009BFC8FE|nr:Fe(3+) ABC transporter substrate-binding protein [Sporosarcina sp. P33]ARD47386.1 Fe(3+) ABC transporter substrate-binding protein [Sporosarcina sp. P33]
MKKNLLWAFALLLAAAVLGACSSSSDKGKQTDEPAKEEAPAGDATDANKDEKTGGEVNIYTARHYDVDAILYEDFTEKTGIKVNVIEAKAPELIERLKREGKNTPADLFVTVDGGILHSAKEEDLLQAVESEVIEENVPAELRDPDNQWIGLSTRARVIVYSKDRVKPEELSTYEDLATDKWKDKLLVRSSDSLYNQSLLASLIAIDGEDKAKEWAQGIVNNLAREPEGGDRDQARAIVAGVGDVAIMNSYYVGRMSVSDEAEDVKVFDQIGVFFPNQETTGTHINISGAGLVKHSKNKENAVKLIEYLTSVEAQEEVSKENFEFPVNEEAKLPEVMAEWGTFTPQKVEFADYGKYNPKAVELMNEVGWK